MSVPRPSRLQIFGERCSGTNYVAQLLRRNLGLEPTDAFGWKHGWLDRVEGPAEHTLFVVVHRDPFDWVRSLHRMPWHAAPALQGLPFDRFLRAPWWCEWGQHMELAADDPRHGTEMLHERDPATGQRFANVLALRTAKHRAWEGLAGRVRHLAAVRYEDAAAAPARVVRELAQRFSLRRWPWLRAVRGEKGGPRRYVEKAPAALAPADIQFVAEQLDHQLERRCGYDLEARVAAERLRVATDVAPRAAGAS
ncbi:MAG: hypothetical protein MUC36_25300 [Planctomycetes bacterium]|jgi:hypothetical protein|nr:hypothetical protein [Planctomycetota bacterium]